MVNRPKTEFLLGIGVGCILSAFLVSIFGVGTISDQEVMARAAKLGMVQRTKLPAPQPSTAEKSKPSEQTQLPKQTAADPADSKEGPPLKGSTETPPGEAKARPSETTVVTILDRMGSEAIARILEEKGIIKDQDEFLKVVSQHDAHQRLQTGTFRVPVDGDLEEILDILLGKKR